VSTQPSFAAVDPQPEPDSSLADFFDRDERIALIFRDKCWSRADLAAGAERFASGLLRAGVQVGDRVILHLTEGVDIALLYLACFRIGAIACPIYSHYQTLELERMFRRLGPALYVGHAELYPKVQALDNCILPAQSRFIIGATDGTSARSWSSLLGSVAGAYPPDVDLHAAAVLLATSGTTGEPKLVAHSQASLAAYARKMAYREFYAGQIIAYSLELAHMPGIGHLLASLYHGATLVVVDRNDPEAILDAIENQQCTYLTRRAGTPPPAHQCTASPSQEC
jgi:acyl-coenzyme A synthetase/AMP-(fatty) acid ligase